MEIIKHDTFRSQGKGLNESDDMVRVVVDMTRREFINFKSPPPPTASKEWTKEPPKEGGEYWHWDGDEDHAVYHLDVAYSGTSRTCFVMSGQLQLARAVDCDKWGGWWQKCEIPKRPCDV